MTALLTVLHTENPNVPNHWLVGGVTLAILMALLAFAFTGHGVKALQEAGLIAASPVGSFSVDMLGVYPTFETLLAQALVALLIVGAYGWTNARRDRPAE